jgi:hypothetical protein
MLEGWHEFYALLGTAAAALVALLFVAATIGAGYLSAERTGPTRTFTSPIVFHYTYVLFLSLVALIPTNTDTSLAAIIGVSAAAALAYSSLILVRVMRSNITDVDDHLGYGSAGRVCGRVRGVSVHLRAFPCRPAAVGRRVDPFVAGQYPQRLGFDGVFRAAANQGKSAFRFDRQLTRQLHQTPGQEFARGALGWAGIYRR